MGVLICRMAETSGKIPKIVVIGGGTGIFSVLSGLKKYPVDLAAVISMSDDGGSTGILREEFGILPPGDVRRALIAMSHTGDRTLSDLFNYRFAEGGLSGHAFGNIMLTALERICGSFETAVDEAARILGVRGNVLPVTLDNVRLCAKLEDGSIIRGETNIDIPKHDGGMKIVKIWLEPVAKINPRVRRAITEAEMVVIGPGDLYSSILPNLRVDGVTAALQRSRAKKIYVVSLMTKWGETHGFGAGDFIKVIEKYLGGGILDYAVINTKEPSRDRLNKYEEERAEFVRAEKLPGGATPIRGDFLRRRGFVRHDPEALAKILMSLL